MTQPAANEIGARGKAMFSSTIIPTIGRRTLSRAVRSVLEQDFQEEDFEVIVVNDSGRPLPEMEGLGSPRVRVVDTDRRNRSVARNTGAAMARGRYLHFLDDDDWILPGALKSLWELAAVSQAAWLYGGFRLVDNAGNLISEIHPQEEGNCLVQAIASEWIPLQASIIESGAFFAVEGFASLPSLLGGYEDIDLSRKIAQRHDWAGTSHVVASIRTGDAGSSTNYTNFFNQNRQSREIALAEPGAFARIVASARASKDSPGYWLGKSVYYYVASVRWNYQRRRIPATVSRAASAVGGFIAAGPHILSPDFWRGLSAPHLNRVRTSLEESGVNLYANTSWGR